MTGRVALVTGGTRGIGLGCAEAWPARAFDLALCGVRPAEQVAPTLRKLEDLGAEPLYLQVDIGAMMLPKRLVGAVATRFGRLDLLVNNAGVAPRERRGSAGRHEGELR